MASIDTLRRFRDNLNEFSNSVNSQVALGEWSFSVDTKDNLLIKKGNVVHTTVSPNGDMVTPSVVMPNGLVFDGDMICGVTDRDIMSGPRTMTPNLVSTITIQADAPREKPFGYITAMSNDGMWTATSDGLDGHIQYGRVIVNNKKSSNLQSTVLTSPSGTLNANMFGSALHINADGSRIYVGEPGLDCVHIFERDGGGTWHLNSTINSPITGAFFGTSLAVADDMFLAVGAPAAASNTGAVYIYEWTNTAWILKCAQNGNARIPNYQLGTNVVISIDANIIVATAVGSTAVYSTSGTVEIYKKVGNASWILNKKLITPIASNSSTLFGRAVEISDDAKHIFVSDAEMPIGVASGHVYVYTLSRGDWVLISTLKAGRNAGARFGWTIKEKNGVLYVGAPGDNNGGLYANAGYVTVFKKQRDEWFLSHHMAPPAGFASSGAYFGWAISAASSDLVAITMPFNGDGYLFYYEPNGFNTSGVITKTQTLLPYKKDTYNIGDAAEPYTNIYLQNAPTVISDRDKKINIRDVERDITFINSIDPITYTMRGKNDVHRNGFMSQQVVDNAFGAGVAIEKDGRHLIRPHEFIPPIVKSCQQIIAELDSLKIYIQ